MEEKSDAGQAMLDELTFATAQCEMLERDLNATRFRRDDLILDLLGTKVSRADISKAAGLAEISIYKIAARVRERRAAMEPVEKKARTRKVKIKPIVVIEAEVVNDGAHPLLGWTLAADAA